MKILPGFFLAALFVAATAFVAINPPSPTQAAELEVTTIDGADWYRLPTDLAIATTAGRPGVARAHVPMPRPLLFDAKDDSYHGVLRIGIFGLESDRKTAVPLAEPTTYHVKGPFRASPADVSFGEAGGALREISIVTRENDPALTVTLVEERSGDATTLPLPLQAPRLLISTDRSGGVRGLGLENCSVRVWAADGMRFSGREIRLSTSRGSLSTDKVRLDTSGSAKVTLRSAGIGEATIRAHGYPFASASTDVRFGLPFAFIVSGFSGAMLAAMLLERLSGLVIPLVFGTAGTVLAAIGVENTTVTLTFPRGEAVAFLVSFALTYLGVLLLGLLSGRGGDAGAASAS